MMLFMLDVAARFAIHVLLVFVLHGWNVDSLHHLCEFYIYERNVYLTNIK